MLELIAEALRIGSHHAGGDLWFWPRRTCGFERLMGRPGSTSHPSTLWPLYSSFTLRDPCDLIRVNDDGRQVA